MPSFYELPEYQIFHLYRPGDEESFGPFSQNQIVHLLNEERLSRTDLVYYQALGRWARLEDVFEIHDRVCNLESDGQDPELVSRVFVELTQTIHEAEDLYYIALQDRPSLASRRTRAVVVSDEGLWIGVMTRSNPFTGGRIHWDEIRRVSARYPSRWDRGVLAVDLTSGETIETHRIPRRQLRRIVALSREITAERWNRKWQRPSPAPNPFAPRVA